MAPHMIILIHVDKHSLKEAWVCGVHPLVWYIRKMVILSVPGSGMVGHLLNLNIPTPHAVRSDARPWSFHHHLRIRASVRPSLLMSRPSGAISRLCRSVRCMGWNCQQGSDLRHPTSFLYHPTSLSLTDQHQWLAFADEVPQIRIPKP